MPSGGGNENEMETQLIACRCLAHLMEALPGSGHTLVQLGAVPVLCNKLNEISYIELAEQTLSVSRLFRPLCMKLTYRRWRRYRANTPLQSSKKEVLEHSSTTSTSSRRTFSGQLSMRLQTVAGTSRATVIKRSKTSFQLFARLSLLPISDWWNLPLWLLYGLSKLSDTILLISKVSSIYQPPSLSTHSSCHLADHPFFPQRHTLISSRL